MALRPDRDTVQTDISYFMDTTGEAGGILTLATAGSGVALDDGNAVVAYDATGSGKVPIGILMLDVVNKDLTQTHLNYYKTEVQIGDKVPVLQDGWVVTNRIYPGDTPAAGDIAYVSASGFVRSTRTNTGWSTVGRFLSTKDSDGYAKLYVKLPNLA